MDKDRDTNEKKLRVLSLFSGCGGMDLGFEGDFIAPSRSFATDSPYISQHIDDDWVIVKPTRFVTAFANDILPEARTAWKAYMSRRDRQEGIYHFGSIVDYVKRHNQGEKIFPDNIDVVTGGFPCQDFSVAGKRMGFQSQKDDFGKTRADDKPSEESRGKLYFWMKQVIDIVRPKIFIAENVKGLVNLGNVKEIIQRDFASAGGDGYIVLDPRVLHAGDYGVPESRERVIFIGIRRDALRPEALKALESGNVPDDFNPYPLPTHACTSNDKSLLPQVNSWDVLKGLKEPHESDDPAQQSYSRAKHMAKGQGQIEINLNGLAPTIRSEHHGNIEFRRLSAEHGGKNANELAAGMIERRLTPRECALIQTFPPDYPFVIPNPSGRGYILSPSGAYKIIGNAVPPLLAYHIATRLQSLWHNLFPCPTT